MGRDIKIYPPLSEFLKYIEIYRYTRFSICIENETNIYGIYEYDNRILEEVLLTWTRKRFAYVTIKVDAYEDDKEGTKKINWKLKIPFSSHSNTWSSIRDTNLEETRLTSWRERSLESISLWCRVEQQLNRQQAILAANLERRRRQIWSLSAWRSTKIIRNS